MSGNVDPQRCHVYWYDLCLVGFSLLFFNSHYFLPQSCVCVLNSQIPAVEKLNGNSYISERTAVLLCNLYSSKHSNVSSPSFNSPGSLFLSFLLQLFCSRGVQVPDHDGGGERRGWSLPEALEQTQTEDQHGALLLLLPLSPTGGHHTVTPRNTAPSARQNKHCFIAFSFLFFYNLRGGICKLYVTSVWGSFCLFLTDKSLFLSEGREICLETHKLKQILEKCC